MENNPHRPVHKVFRSLIVRKSLYPSAWYSGICKYMVVQRKKGWRSDFGRKENLLNKFPKKNGLCLPRFSQTRLEQSLKNTMMERNVFLRELNHRVRNMIQVLVSLMNLESADVEDDETKQIIERCSHRIRVIGIILDKSYDAAKIGTVSCKEMFREIISVFSNMRKLERHKITAQISGTDEMISVNQVLPLGLLLNELLVVLSEYWKQQKTERRLIVTMTNVYGAVEICMEAPDIEIQEHQFSAIYDSLSYSLLLSLAEQISGTITWERDAGNKFELRFHPASETGRTP